MDIALQFIIDISTVVMDSRLTTFLSFFYFILFLKDVLFENELHKIIRRSNCSDGVSVLYSLCVIM